MTFEDDMCKIGDLFIKCVSMGVLWPPPKELNINGTRYTLVSYSKITDDERKAMTHVVRGAEYKLSDELIICAVTGCENESFRTYGGRPHCYDCLPPMMKH